MAPNVKQSIAVSHVKLNSPSLNKSTMLNIKFNENNKKNIAKAQEIIR